MEDSEFVTEEWVYLGPDPSGKGYRWRDPSNEELLYGKLKARLFGGIYTIQVRRSADSVSALPDAGYTGRYPEDTALIQARAVENETLVRLRRLEANTSRVAKLDEALEPLLDLVAGIPLMSDRRALLDYVTGKVYGIRKGAR